MQTKLILTIGSSFCTVCMFLVIKRNHHSILSYDSLLLSNHETLRFISVVDVVGPMNPYQPIYTIPHLIFCRIPVQNFNLCWLKHLQR